MISFHVDSNRYVMCNDLSELIADNYAVNYESVAVLS